MSTDFLKNIAMGIKPVESLAEKTEMLPVVATVREYRALVEDSTKLNILRQAFAKLPGYEFTDLAAIVLGVEPPKSGPLGDLSLDNAFSLETVPKTEAE